MKTEKIIELRRKERLNFKQRLIRDLKRLVHLSLICALFFVGYELHSLKKIVADTYFEAVGIANFNERNRPVWEALKAEGFECSIDKNQFAKLEGK